MSDEINKKQLRRNSIKLKDNENDDDSNDHENAYKQVPRGSIVTDMNEQIEIQQRQNQIKYHKMKLVAMGLFAFTIVTTSIILAVTLTKSSGNGSSGNDKTLDAAKSGSKLHAFTDDAVSSATLDYVKIKNGPNSDSHRIVEIESNSECFNETKIEFECEGGADHGYHVLKYKDFGRKDKLKLFQGSDFQFLCLAKEPYDMEYSLCMISGIQKDFQSHHDVHKLYKMPGNVARHLHKHDADKLGELPGVEEIDLSDKNIDYHDLDTLPSELHDFYDGMGEIVDGMVLTAFKLSMGDDQHSCSTQLKVWSLYESVAFKDHFDNDCHSLQHFTQQTHCIREIRENPDIDNNDKAAISDALDKCMQQNYDKELGKDNKRKLLSDYTCNEIGALVENKNHCPLGEQYLNVPEAENEFMGMCGYGATCWDWVCPGNAYNGNSGCGCNNGCFEHDYTCSCIGLYHPYCFSFVNAVFPDEICHAGSTCITIKGVNNLGSVTSNNDPWWGTGDPYVAVKPMEPHEDGYLETHYYSNYGSSGYTSYNVEMCWSMRISKFKVEIWDDDYDGDDLIAGPYYVNNQLQAGKQTDGTVGGSATIYYKIKNRW